jgi:hypothetical protein
VVLPRQRSQADAAEPRCGQVVRWDESATRLANGNYWYEYPPNLFTNESGDILWWCGATLDQLGGGVAVLAAERYFGGAAGGGSAAGRVRRAKY